MVLTAPEMNHVVVTEDMLKNLAKPGSEKFDNADYEQPFPCFLQQHR